MIKFTKKFVNDLAAEGFFGKQSEIAEEVRREWVSRMPPYGTALTQCELFKALNVTIKEAERTAFARVSRRTHPDVRVSNHGTIFIVEPITDEAKVWVQGNVATESWMGRGFAVEHRFIGDLLQGMEDDGLTIE